MFSAVVVFSGTWRGVMVCGTSYNTSERIGQEELMKIIMLKETREREVSLYSQNSHLKTLIDRSGLFYFLKCNTSLF